MPSSSFSSTLPDSSILNSPEICTGISFCYDVIDHHATAVVTGVWNLHRGWGSSKQNIVAWRLSYQSFHEFKTILMAITILVTSALLGKIQRWNKNWGVASHGASHILHVSLTPQCTEVEIKHHESQKQHLISQYKTRVVGLPQHWYIG